MSARALASFLALASGCTPVPRDGGASRPAGPAGKALVAVATAAGDPVGVGTTWTVDASGGRFDAPDGGLSVWFPEGAVTTATPIAIQPIDNLARGAIGPAYRLLPDGTTFALPVTLTFDAPDAYPTGTSLAGVGVETQDADGFWRRVEPVTRDPVAKTVAVSTTHFSDWAVTWQGGTAAAEGPISLVQSYGVPFVASGRATVYFLSDDPYDTIYGLTGTLTVPETIARGDETCVPDQRTKTLPLNTAEAHKAAVPVFRWGIGVHWTLTCTAPGGAVTTGVLLPALFDTMSINLTRCPGAYAAGQVVSPDQLAGTYTKDCGVDGVVSATWDLRACVEGQPCSTGVECRTAGLTACTDGVQSCEDAPAPDGTPCGPAAAGSCLAGVCELP